MEPDTPELESTDIVMVGSFNPGIFHPAWLSSRGLLPEGDAEEAQINIVTPDVSQFSTEWLTVEVLAGRLRLATNLPPYYPSLRDLALGVLRLLPQTPISAIGFNYLAHFKLKNDDVWHLLGHRLAPKDLWAQILKNPGMRRLVIEAQREDERDGYVLITVEPSMRVQPGVFVSTNDHYAGPPIEKGEGATWALDVINDCWDESTEKSHGYLRAIVEHANLSSDGVDGNRE